MSDEAPKTRHKPLALLSNPEFRLLVYIRLFTVLGVQINSVAVGWRIYDLTKDPLYLGLIGLAEAIPAMGIALYAGHVADHAPRRKITLWSLGVLLVCFVILTFTALPGQNLASQSQMILIYGAIIGNGFARGFATPALFSMQGEIVPRERLPESSTILSATWQAASILGPAICGFIYAFFGPAITFGLSTLLILGAINSVRRVKKRPAPQHETRQPLWESIREGIRFVFSTQLLLAAITLDLFAVLFGGAVALLPAVSDQILHLGPEGLGLLRAAPGVGALLIAFVLLRYPLKLHPGWTLLVVVAGYGACMIVFGLSTHFWLSMVVLALSGVFDNISVVIRRTILQVFTPDVMRGRVSAVESIFIASSNEIGEFESGVTAKIFGLERSIILGGILSIGVTGLTAWLSPRLRSYKSLKEKPDWA